MFGTVILLGTLTFILLFVGFLLGGPVGVALALALAIGINSLTYWYSDRIVLGMYRARPSESKELKAVVEGLAKDARIPVPALYEIPSEAPNAFATGRNPSHSAVAVTHGLLKLENKEIRAVIAHEIGHIRNRDTLIAVMAATISGAIAYLAQVGYWSLFNNGQRNEGNLIGILLIAVFAPIAALLLRLAISRSREYKADEFGSMITKDPGSLASALRKIDMMSRHNPMKAGSAATSHMWIVNPFRTDWFTGLFSTHPPIQRRIEMLKKLEGG